MTDLPPLAEFLRVTPSALRQFFTAFALTPHQCMTATADSCRTARASSSSTSRPDPPPGESRARQRGQGTRASDQQVMTTVVSRYRQVARSPRLRGGAW
jgi:hypothetical protein